VADSPVCYRLQSGPLHCAGFIPQPTFHSSANLPRQPGEIRALPKRYQQNLVAALLARLEPSLRFRFSLIALGGQRKNGRETTSGQDQQYRREALPIAEDNSNSTARLRAVQATSIIREIGHFCTASISLASLRRTETTELTAKNYFDRHPGAGLRGLLVSAEGTDKSQPAIIPLRASVGESVNHVIALPRRRQERVQTPRQNIASFAATLSCRNASGTITQHTLSVWSFLPP